jgi:hypothetical protein
MGLCPNPHFILCLETKNEARKFNLPALHSPSDGRQGQNPARLCMSHILAGGDSSPLWRKTGISNKGNRSTGQLKQLFVHIKVYDCPVLLNPASRSLYKKFQALHHSPLVCIAFCPLQPTVLRFNAVPLFNAVMARSIASW